MTAGLVGRTWEERPRGRRTWVSGTRRGRLVYVSLKWTPGSRPCSVGRC